MVALGKLNTLKVIQMLQGGALLEGDVFLPKRQVPRDLKVGGSIEVMVYPDGNGQLEASTSLPLAQVDHVAWLKVVGVTRVGAFLHWGVPKDLLLPSREQLEPLQQGDYCMVKIFVDEHQRITASEQLDDFIDAESHDFKQGQKVSLVICGSSELGTTVVVDDKVWGLLYKDEIFTDLQVGQRVDGYIKPLREDGKIDVTLNAPGYSKVNGIAGDILAKLEKHKGFLPYNDKSHPDEIYRMFGVSKKAFKQAIGTLFKQREIVIEDEGIRIAKK